LKFFVKMAVFWLVAPCSLVERDAAVQKTAIFVLTAVMTSGPRYIMFTVGEGINIVFILNILACAFGLFRAI
jgi:hypothetical protein